MKTYARERQFSREFIASLLTYEPENSELRWRPRPPEMFATQAAWKIWNKRYAGAVAGGVKRLGYRILTFTVNGKAVHLPAHRIVWLFETGAWPSHDIDHIDGNPKNNAFSNLREAPSGVNERNRRRYSHNKSGVSGVWWSAKEERWFAKISVAGRRIHLGQHKSFEAAVARRREAERKYGYHPNHGRAA